MSRYRHPSNGLWRTSIIRFRFVDADIRAELIHVETKSTESRELS
jgi:hypothetical protein